MTQKSKADSSDADLEVVGEGLEIYMFNKPARVDWWGFYSWWAECWVLSSLPWLLSSSTIFHLLLLLMPWPKDSTVAWGWLLLGVQLIEQKVSACWRPLQPKWSFPNVTLQSKIQYKSVSPWSRNRLVDIENRPEVANWRWVGRTGSLGLADVVMYRVDGQQAPAIEHRDLCSVACDRPSWIRMWKRIYSCVIESLCCTKEIHTVL